MRRTDPEYYLNLWKTTEILKEKVEKVKSYSEKILSFKDRYKAIADKNNIVWYLVGAIHMKECEFSFKHGLANGDPLSKMTVRVPKNIGPFDTFEDSADWALSSQKYAYPKDGVWNISAVLAFAEKYNGLGYAKKDKNSPYLWSCSNHGVGTGFYVSDGRYNPDVDNDGIPGVATVIRFINDNLEAIITNE